MLVTTMEEPRSMKVSPRVYYFLRALRGEKRPGPSDRTLADVLDDLLEKDLAYHDAMMEKKMDEYDEECECDPEDDDCFESDDE